MQKQDIDTDIEIEMKFLATRTEDLSAAADTFQAMAQDIIRTRDFVTTLHYHDTAERDLLCNGVILRALDASPPHFGSHIEIKSNPTAKEKENSAAITRAEYCIPISANGLLLDEIKDHPAATLLAPANNKNLKHWFTTVNERQDIRGVFNVDGKKAVVDCCIDRVEFFDATGGKIHQAFEVEIELKQDHSDAALTPVLAEKLLNEISGILRDNIKGLSVHNSTRADIGFSLIPPPPAKPRYLRPTPKL